MMKASNPRSYASCIFRLINKYVLPFADCSFDRSTFSYLDHPPIFILGPPRCGSTLLCQVLTEALDLGYLSNRHCRFYGAPALSEKLFHPTAHRLPSRFTSNHGVTHLPHEPSECGLWWYRFFRQYPAYVNLADADPKKMRAFRQSVYNLISSFDKPVLFKNLYSSFRIQPIARYLPESLFILLSRNEIDNGHSLLETRHKVFDSYDQWWSMEPISINYLKTLPAYQQVIEQIRHIRATIKDDLQLADVNPSRCFHVSYEDFCSRPNLVVENFKRFLMSHGSKVEKVLSVPEHFHRRTNINIDIELYHKMVDYVHAD